MLLLMRQHACIIYSTFRTHNNA